MNMNCSVLQFDQFKSCVTVFSKLKIVKPNKNKFSLAYLIFTNPLEVQILNWTAVNQNR